MAVDIDGGLLCVSSGVAVSLKFIRLFISSEINCPFVGNNRRGCLSMILGHEGGAMVMKWNRD